MASPEHRLPRDWTKTPLRFGIDVEIDWWPAPLGKSEEAFQARAARRAATLQHGVACAAHKRLLRAGYKDLTALANSGLGISYSQLHKILHGAAPMTFKHVAVLEERLGPLLVVKLSGPTR